MNPVGVVGAIEYEHLLGNRVSLGARLSYIDYDYKDGSCRNRTVGAPSSWCASTRAAGAQGFYVGGAVGVWNTS